MEVTTPLGQDVLLIIGFSGVESMSRLFQFHVDMVADVNTTISFEQVLGQNVSVRLTLQTGEKRYFSGICNRFSQGEPDIESNFTAYQMEMVPQFWMLTKIAQTRIFQQMSVPDILKKVLQGLDVEYQLQGKYEPRNFCVQYRETDFNFASRLMEDEGIFYFFKHNESSSTLVIGDSPQANQQLPQQSTLIFEKGLGILWQQERVLSWEKMQELMTGKFTDWDHAFQFPYRNMEAKKNIQDSVTAGSVTHQLTAGTANSREVYDYPGDYVPRFDDVDPGGGDQPQVMQKVFPDSTRTIGIRAGQEAATGVTIHGTSTCRNLCTGYKFTLDRLDNANGDYLLTSVHHQTATPIDYRTGGGDEYHYINSFTAIPAEMQFRPQRITPKPFVQGTQTAVVVGPQGEEIFTDKYGRVKVQFFWDRDGQHDAKSSCWVRVTQPWAGKRWGTSFWPRIGQEVIIDFLEGNPDWPIIVGTVYNADQMPPYLGKGLDPEHPNDNKLSGLKTNSTLGGEGFNEWRFDDTKSKEQIFIHGQRNLDVRILNDRMERIIHDSHLIVGAQDKNGNKSGNQNEQVYQDKNLNVKRNQIEQIEGNVQQTVGHGDADDPAGNVDIVIEKVKKELIEDANHLHVKAGQLILVDGGQDITIKDHKTETIKADNQLHVTGDSSEKVDGTHSLSVGQNQQAKVGQNHALEAGQEIHLKAGMKVILEAGVQLTIKAAGGFVDIGPAGVTIQGTMVLINSGGSAGSGSGSSPTSPQDAKLPDDAQIAKPLVPTQADDSVSGIKSVPDSWS